MSNKNDLLDLRTQYRNWSIRVPLECVPTGWNHSHHCLPTAIIIGEGRSRLPRFIDRSSENWFTVSAEAIEHQRLFICVALRGWSKANINLTFSSGSQYSASLVRHWSREDWVIRSRSVASLWTSFDAYCKRAHLSIEQTASVRPIELLQLLVRTTTAGMKDDIIDVSLFLLSHLKTNGAAPFSHRCT